MTNRSSTILASCAVVALSVAVVSPAFASSAKPEIGYFLSRTDVAVSVAMTLTSCPSEPGGLPKVAIDWKAVPTGAADRQPAVRVDVSSGFLAKRSNAFEFYPNGTLSGFNGSSEGQAGAVIGSVLKVVGTVAPLLASSHGAANLIGKLVCKAAIRDKLEALTTIKTEIGLLEANVLLDTATPAELELLDRKRKKQATILKQLTIEADADFAAQGPESPWNGKVKPDLFKTWFEPDPLSGPLSFDRSKIPGIEGFRVTIFPEQFGPVTVEDCKAGPVLTTDKHPKSSLTQSGVQRAFYYRRPVQAAVLITDPAGTAPDCSQQLPLDVPLPIGQWGDVLALPVGNAGLFGSREASASFDQFGTPLKLSYGSDSGAADIGSTIEAAGGAVTAFADADTAALEREIKREELRQKLRELRATAAE